MIHLLHHANCADGFAAACIAHQFLGGSGLPHPHIRLQPVNYGWPLQKPDGVDIAPGDHIYYLDYTPPRDVLECLYTTWGTSVGVTVIDHHRTAQPVHDWLAQQPLDAFRYNSVFDLTHSGAALTWRHFSGLFNTMPWAVRLIEHRDLGHAWQKHSAESEAAFRLHAALFRLLPRTVEAWLPVLMGPAMTLECIEDGRALRDADARIISTAAENPHWLCFDRSIITAGWDGLKDTAKAFVTAVYRSPLNVYLADEPEEPVVRIPAVNGLGPELNSEACGALLERWPQSPFAAAWWVDPKTGRFTYSLRSRQTPGLTYDVAALAARLDPPRPGYSGGGGHPQAAGFSLAHPLKIDRSANLP